MNERMLSAPHPGPRGQSLEWVDGRHDGLIKLRSRND